MSKTKWVQSYIQGGMQYFPYHNQDISIKPESQGWEGRKFVVFPISYWAVCCNGRTRQTSPFKLGLVCRAKIQLKFQILFQIISIGNFSYWIHAIFIKRIGFHCKHFFYLLNVNSKLSSFLSLIVHLS